MYYGRNFFGDNNKFSPQNAVRFTEAAALRSQRRKAEGRGGEENRRPFHGVKALCVRFRRRGVTPRENALRMVLRNF